MNGTIATAATAHCAYTATMKVIVIALVITGGGAAVGRCCGVCCSGGRGVIARRCIRVNNGQVSNPLLHLEKLNNGWHLLSIDCHLDEVWHTVRKNEIQDTMERVIRILQRSLFGCVCCKASGK